MAEHQPGFWGIDIGQCALKAIRLQEINGQVVATAFDYVEHPKILSQPDADPDQLTRQALETFLSHNSLKGDEIAISVPGQSGLARFVKLPPVEEKKIPDIVRFEAKQQIPFPLEEVVWDYQKVGSGQVTDGFAMETEIGLFALKRDMVGRYLQHFKDVNVEVHVVQMSPLALCNYLAYDLLKKDPGSDEKKAEVDAAEKKAEKPGQRPCVVALDIGTDNSNLVVTDGERIIWQRPIPFGGNHFTRALTKDLKMTFAKAEHLKRNATKSPDLKRILAALKPVLNDFVGEVQRSLGYFTNTHRNAQIAYMMGLGNAFRLPGLQKFLSEKLQLDVRRLQNFERLSGESVTGAALFTQNVMSFPTAYGLALQGLHKTRLATNLLPPEIQFERMIRAKKPWAVSAAAALLFGVFATTVNYALAYRAVAAETVQEAIKQGDDLTSRVAQDAGAFDKKNKDVAAKEVGVRTIIAGKDNQLNWLMINRYINECLPMPGALLEGKIKSADRKQIVVKDREGKERRFAADDVLVLVGEKPVETRDIKEGTDVRVVYNDQLTDKSKPYWTREAQRAFLKYWERRALGRITPQPEDEGVSDLMQINIEHIQPVYSTDLKQYIERIKHNPKAQDLKGMIEKDQKEPPSGPGWIFELRGYTYFKDAGGGFLQDTLVYNLGTKGRKETITSQSKDAAAGKSAELTPAEKEKQDLWNRAIVDRVSHALLYDYKTTHEKVTGVYALPPVGAELAVAPPNAPAPLITSSAVAAAGPAAAGGGAVDFETMGRGFARRFKGGSGSSPPPAASTPGVLAPPGGSTKAKPGTPARVDFIVLFVWKEPT